MTRKLLIIVGCLLSVILIVLIYEKIFYLKFPVAANCTIVSDEGTSIPAKLYSRVIEDSGENVEEFILSFNDTLIAVQSNISKNEKLQKYLLIIPKLKTIGLMEESNSPKEKNGYILQT